MVLEPIGQLLLAPLRSAYPFQLQPTISLPDFLVNTIGGNAVSLVNMVADPVIAGVHAQPVLVPHNQRIASGGGITPRDNNAYLDSGMPDWLWDSTSSVSGSTVSCQCFRGRFFGQQNLSFAWNDSTSPTGATFNLKRTLSASNPDDRIMGFTVFISRTVFNRVPSGGTASYEFQWEVQTTLYSVLVSTAAGIVFRRSTDGGVTWKNITSNLKGGGNPATLLGNSSPENPLVFQVILMNGMMQIRLGALSVPYPYKVGILATRISKVNVLANTFTQCGVDVYPLYWSTVSQLRSNPLALGFNPDASTPPYYYVAGSNGVTRVSSGGSIPNGTSSISVTRVGLVTDAEQSYDLQITNHSDLTYNTVNYSKTTAWVNRVVIHVDGRWAAAASAPAAAIPKWIRESTRFDPNGLTIRQHIQFGLDNFYGQWGGQAGNIAVQLNLGYAAPPAGIFPRFTGMCGNYTFERPSTQAGTVTFECCDLLQMLEDQILFAPPLMDGWNHYYAMAYLAQLAGISLSQMAFAALVPSNPFAAAPGDPTPYFLPLGDGMRPWTPRDRENSVLALSNYIRKPAGFLLFFDAQGFLRYEPWIPPSLAPQVKLFTEGPTGTDGENLTEYFHMTLRSSIDDVRNQVLLIGINPYDARWSLLIAKREDTQSIYAAPGSEPKNYVGYKKPFVWTDARFADPAFASDSATRIFQMLRIPGLEVTFETWMQPQIYVMDVVYINEHKSGVSGVPFYVMGTDVDWSYQGDGKPRFRTTISGRFLL